MAFYTALFGWELRPWEMADGETYDMLYAGEVGIGGVMPHHAAATGVPSHWIGYLAVSDVDATCVHAQAAGAKELFPPTDIPTVGRFASLEDPTGARFSPFASSSPAMPEPANAPLGTVAWNELMTPDGERAATFYAGLTGWEVQEMDMGPLGVYRVCRRGTTPVCGIMQLPADAPVAAHWLPYIAVASADAAAARVTALGGELRVPPTDLEDWGRFAMAVDPTGAVFGVLENKRPM